MAILLLSSIMLVSAMLYVKKKSCSNKLPAKYGRYQRNVFTFKQSFLYNLYGQFVFLFGTFSIVFFSYLELPQKTLFYFLQIHFAIFYSLIPGFFVPLILLWKLRSNLPELFCSFKINSLRIKNQFYVTDFEIYPKRDFEGQKKMGSIRKYNPVIHVKPYTIDYTNDK